MHNVPIYAAHTRPHRGCSTASRCHRRYSGRCAPSSRARVSVLGIEPLVRLGSVPAAGGHCLHIIDQGLMAFGKIGGFRPPIRHLDVDVVMVVAGPRRFDIIIPQPLQVGRERAGPGTGQQQIAAELEHGFLQIGVCRIFLIGLQTLRRRQLGYILLRFPKLTFTRSNMDLYWEMWDCFRAA